MSQTLVSVVIPTYNRAGLIAQSIRSALAQTHRNLEIIVVDDGSTDNTKEVVASFGPSIQYFYKANSGPSPTRNLGIQKAKGEYVAFLDSDDLWEPTKIEKQLRCFEQNPQAAMVSTNYRLIDLQGRIIKDPGSKPGYIPSDFIVKDMLQIKFPFATPAFVIRKSVLEKIGAFNENLKISEDLDLLIRIGVNYQIGYVDEVLVSVRMHDNHLMRETPRYQVWLDSVHVLESHQDAIRKRLPDMNKYLANFYSRAGNSALLLGNRSKAFEIYRQAVRYQPFGLKGYKDCVRCLLPMKYLREKNERCLKGEIPKGLENYK